VLDVGFFQLLFPLFADFSLFCFAGRALDSSPPCDFGVRLRARLSCGRNDRTVRHYCAVRRTADLADVAVAHAARLSSPTLAQGTADFVQPGRISDRYACPGYLDAPGDGRLKQQLFHPASHAGTVLGTLSADF
jgi:hypothetical protein